MGKDIAALGLYIDIRVELVGCNPLTPTQYLTVYYMCISLCHYYCALP